MNGVRYIRPLDFPKGLSSELFDLFIFVQMISLCDTVADDNRPLLFNDNEKYNINVSFQRIY